MTLVPRGHLLALTAAVLLPSALAYAAAPQAAGLLAALCLGLAAVAAADAVLSRGALRQVGVELPPVVRLTRGREGLLDVTLVDRSRRGRRLRVAVALPEPLTGDDELLVRLPAGEPRSHASLALTSPRRGRFHVSTCALEAASPAGLWSAVSRVPVSAEVRVYPDLRAETRALASVFLKRGGAGEHSVRQIGRGREFEKLREYVPGDATDEIHWKATARRGRPITKVFQVERTQEVYVVLDASRLSARPAPTKEGEGEGDPTLERFVSAALLLSFAAERQGDRFGLVTFDAQPRAFLRARSGLAHARACREALATVEAAPVTPDFDELAAFLKVRLRRRALLLFLTELDDPVLAEAFTRSAGILSKQHLVVAHGIRPPAARPLFSEDDASSAEDVYARLAGHLVWRALRELTGALGKQGVAYSLLSSDALAVELVASYLKVKKRQIL